MALQKVTNILNSLKKHKKKSHPIPPEVWQNPLYFIAFGFGSGAIPFAPGTFGTLFAIPFYLILSHLPLFWYLIIVGIVIIASSWVCHKISAETNTNDHPGMCIDEFAGFFVTMINAPLGCIWVIIGFILFRFFDIIKPWPIRWLDKNIHGGIGMVLDDVAAGIAAMLIIQILRVF